MLESIVKENTTLVNLKVSDWQDAIQKAAQPLIDEGDITENYVDGILESVKEFGPYFVLAPHVALAHAPSDQGALKLALGVAVLADPIEFHSKDNDPVKYLFTLSSPDSNSHLTAMQEMVGFLSDPTFYDKLDNAKSAQEVVEIMSVK